MNPSDAVTSLGDPDAPGVLLLHPWWGVTPAVRWWAEQIASVGRRVVVPDLYGGVVAATVEEAEAIEGSLDYDAATAIVARHADGIAAAGRPWAAMGFSMGAFLACRLAGRGDAAPAELVLFYGAGLPRGDVRTRRVDLHVVPGDPWFGDEDQGEAEAAFQAVGAEVTVHRYDGAGHWFAEAGSPGYDEAAASLARDRVLDRLRVPTG